MATQALLGLHGSAPNTDGVLGKTASKRNPTAPSPVGRPATATLLSHNLVYAQHRQSPSPFELVLKSNCPADNTQEMRHDHFLQRYPAGGEGDMSSTARVLGSSSPGTFIQSGTTSRGGQTLHGRSTHQPFGNRSALASYDLRFLQRQQQQVLQREMALQRFHSQQDQEQQEQLERATKRDTHAEVTDNDDCLVSHERHPRGAFSDLFVGAAAYAFATHIRPDTGGGLNLTASSPSSRDGSGIYENERDRLSCSGTKKEEEGIYDDVHHRGGNGGNTGKRREEGGTEAQLQQQQQQQEVEEIRHPFYNVGADIMVKPQPADNDSARRGGDEDCRQSCGPLPSLSQLLLINNRRWKNT